MLHASLSSTANRDLLQPSQHLCKIKGNRDRRWVLEQQRAPAAGRPHTKIRTGVPALSSLGEGHQLGSLHGGPEHSTWAPHSNSSGCPKLLASLGACQAAGSHANLDIKMHARWFKWQREKSGWPIKRLVFNAHLWWKTAGLEVNSASPRRGHGWVVSHYYCFRQ